MIRKWALVEKVVRLAGRLTVRSDLQEQLRKPAMRIARTQPSTQPVFATVNGQEDFFSRAGNRCFANARK
ncbi:hypothetical protein HY495_01695 [Candidatus Woesearchaeota archaeon]|nr:hypothetical protein [Candidatus Woesearchaeota archaeon]